MILNEIRQFLDQQGRASLEEIAHHVKADPGAVKGMLELWVRKGRVKKLSVSDLCGGCKRCETVDFYVSEDRNGVV